MLGRTACTGMARGGRVNTERRRQVGEQWRGRSEGVTLQATRFQELNWDMHLRRKFLTERLFFGGESLLVGLPSAVSGALRLVLRLDLKSSSDYQLIDWPSARQTSLEVTNTHFRVGCCFSATTENDTNVLSVRSWIILQELSYFFQEDQPKKQKKKKSALQRKNFSNYPFSCWEFCQRWTKTVVPVWESLPPRTESRAQWIESFAGWSQSAAAERGRQRQEGGERTSNLWNLSESPANKANRPVAPLSALPRRPRQLRQQRQQRPSHRRVRKLLRLCAKRKVNVNENPSEQHGESWGEDAQQCSRFVANDQTSSLSLRKSVWHNRRLCNGSYPCPQSSSTWLLHPAKNKIKLSIKNNNKVS